MDVGLWKRDSKVLFVKNKQKSSVYVNFQIPLGIQVAVAKDAFGYMSL